MPSYMPDNAFHLLWPICNRAAHVSYIIAHHTVFDDSLMAWRDVDDDEIRRDMSKLHDELFLFPYRWFRVDPLVHPDWHITRRAQLTVPFDDEGAEFVDVDVVEFFNIDGTYTLGGDIPWEELDLILNACVHPEHGKPEHRTSEHCEKVARAANHLEQMARISREVSDTIQETRPAAAAEPKAIEDTQPSTTAPPEAEPVTIPPISATKQLALDILIKQPEGISGALVGKQLVAEMAKRGHEITESTLSKHIMPDLKKFHGVVNRRGGVGYYVERT